MMKLYEFRVGLKLVERDIMTTMHITECGSLRRKELPVKEIKPNPCINKNCHKGCRKITEYKRKTNFEHYWVLNLDTQRRWD